MNCSSARVGPMCAKNAWPRLLILLLAFACPTVANARQGTIPDDAPVAPAGDQKEHPPIGRPRRSIPRAPAEEQVPVAPPAPVTEPTAADLDTLALELALLERAATSPVVVPREAATLGEVLAALSAQSGIPIEADWESLATLGIAPDGPAALRGAEGSLLAVLESLTAHLGVTFGRPRLEATLGRLRLMTDGAARSMRRTRAYRVDLLAEEFMSKAREHIEPEAWMANGGELLHATRVDGTVLVSAPSTAHRRLTALLDELRLTRPLAIELHADIVRLPTAAWRSISLDDGRETITRAALEAEATLHAIGSPSLVAVIDEQAKGAFSIDGIAVELTFRPVWEQDRGSRIEFALRVVHADNEAIGTGSIPAPVMGPAAVVAVDLPGGEQTVVAFLRGRPIPRELSTTGM